MDAETRAALEWAVKEADVMARRVGDRPHYYDQYQARLQALLDEKGGSGVRDGERSRTVNPVASAEQVQILPATPSPDSPAKIAADMVAHRKTWLPEFLIIDKWAARVEALGLEPSEREVVRQVLDSLAFVQRVLGRKGMGESARVIQIVLSALTPIAEKGAGT